MITQVQIPQQDALTGNPNARLSALQFYATILDNVNRENIPKPNELSFKEIHDIDWICENAGGREVARERKPFSPYLENRYGEESMTAYRVGNVLVVNSSFGYHPDRRTTILFVEGKSPDKDIVDRFKKFYGREPQSIRPPKIHQTIELI